MLNGLWMNGASDIGSEKSFSVTTDVIGNSYISGQYSGEMYFDNNHFLADYGYNGSGIFLAKYNSIGDLQWVDSLRGENTSWSASIKADNFGNIYVTGRYSGKFMKIDFDTLWNADTSGYNYDIFLAKYDVNGNLEWVRGAGGKMEDVAFSIATDNDGNIFLAGYFYSSSIIFGHDTLVNDTSSMFLAKFDSAGSELWARTAYGTFWSYAVVSDAAGNAYLTGEFGIGGATFSSFHLTCQGQTDIFLAKYDPNGNVIWAKGAGGNYQDKPYSLAIDASANIYIAGSFMSTTINCGSQSASNWTPGDDDIFLAKYDSSGNALWVKGMGGTQEDRAYSVCTDSYKNVYLTGYFKSGTLYSNSAPVVNNSISNGGNADIIIAKYDSAGNYNWAFASGQFPDDFAQGITSDINNNIFVTGYYNSNALDVGSVSISNTSNSGYSDIFLVKFNGILGIDPNETSANDLSVYPNPNAGNFRINFSENMRNAEIKIFNPVGCVILRQKITSSVQNIDLSNQPSGIYFVELSSDKGVATKKVAINR